MQQEGTDVSSRGGRGGVPRAALLGLCGGAMLGGLILLIVGLKTRLSPPDCAGLSEMECGFIRDTSVEVGRMQTVVGASLLALGAAVIVLVRSRGRPASP